MAQVGLLIVGAGPKGLALAAKHHAISRHCQLDNDYLVLERNGVGAHWTGDHGYTDGLQTLVSPPEQDLGYPYKSYRDLINGDKIDAEMQKLSWESFLVATRRRDDWIVKHRNRPTHKELVEYLQWAGAQISLSHTIGEVDKIDLESDEWLVSWGNENRTACGLVITSHGGPKRVGGKGYENPRISDGRDFWQKLENFEDIQAGDYIGVVGAGETAGTIALAILDIIERNADRMIKGFVKPEIMLVCKQPGYFLRSDVSKDLRYFSDPIEWQELIVAQRLGIIKRADRGVVSSHVKMRLEHSDLVSYHVGKLEWEPGYTVPTEGGFLTQITYGLESESTESVPQPLNFLVSALGFDDMWFLKLFTHRARVKLISHVLDSEDRITSDSLQKSLSKEGKTIEDLENPEVLADNLNEPLVSSWLQKKFEFSIAYDLSVDGFKPKIHLPRLAGLMQGPGFPNLNCLGLLSDRIWCAYEPQLVEKSSSKLLS